MNRELKFKAWYDKAQIFVYLNLNEGISEAGLKIYREITLSGCQFFQYTGLNDFDGKEIYEGDILKYHLDDGEIDHMPVFFEDGSFMVGKYDKEFLSDDLDIKYKFKIQIVSHIKEKPELVSITRAVGV
jgi:hypothetical protein